MKYFSDTYSNYLTKINESSTMSSDSKTILDSSSSSSTTVSKLCTSLSNSDWSELGLQTLIQSTLPSLSSNIETLKQNIGILSNAVSLVVGDLIPTLETLKSENESYELCVASINSLSYSKMKNDDGSFTQEYNDYLVRKKGLEDERDKHKAECDECIKKIESTISQIKALDGSVSDFKVKTTIALTAKDGAHLSLIAGEPTTGKVIKMDYGGREFYVVNTNYPVADYEEYVQREKVYQNAGVLGGECYFLALYYAGDMLKGKSTDKNAVQHMESQPGIDYNVKSANPDPVLQYVYDEVKQGRPTTLQVSQKRSDEGLRHVVTVVGFSEDVQSYKDLTPENILVLDCVDGKVQTLSERNRTLFMQKGVYQAWGANQDFINKYVDTVNA